MRNIYIKQLSLLNSLLIEMGAMIEHAISIAVDALIKQDIALAKKAIEYDNEIDQKERDIESLCLKLLLQQQPVAGDLRLISAALKMITDMERIGDHAADISEITAHLSAAPYRVELTIIREMADATAKMVTESIDAFVNSDLGLANSVIEYDDVVDDLFINIRRDMIELSRTDGEQAMDLLMVAKYFERIGDHAVNIAEWVVFSITGNHIKG